MTGKLLLRSLAPLIVIFALPFLGSLAFFARDWLQNNELRRSQTKQMESSGGRVVVALLHWLPASLLLAFCFTPSVSASIFRAWHCKSFAYSNTEQHSFLAEDLSIRCGDAEHQQVVGVAWVSTFVATS